MSLQPGRDETDLSLPKWLWAVFALIPIVIAVAALKILSPSRPQAATSSPTVVIPPPTPVAAPTPAPAAPETTFEQRRDALLKVINDSAPSPPPAARADDAIADRSWAERPSRGSADFIHAEEYLSRGDIVVLTTDTSCNFMLMDSSNFRCYERGEAFHYYGGNTTRSPATVAAPHGGTWHVVLDLGGGTGSIRYSLRVLRDD